MRSPSCWSCLVNAMQRVTLRNTGSAKSSWKMPIMSRSFLNCTITKVQTEWSFFHLAPSCCAQDGWEERLTCLGPCSRSWHLQPFGEGINTWDFLSLSFPSIFCHSTTEINKSLKHRWINLPINCVFHELNEVALYKSIINHSPSLNWVGILSTSSYVLFPWESTL